MKLTRIFTHEIQPGKLFNIPEQPINVMLDVTTQCNNRCLFCYNPDDHFYREDSADFDTLKQIVSLVGRYGTKEILYLGGEPFSFPFMKEVLEVGKKLDIFQRAITNGAYINNKWICQQLKASGLNEIGISFHSSRELIHDKLSGRKGSFKDALLAVESCLHAGIPLYIQYSPTRLNAHRDIIDLAKMIMNRFGNSIVLFDINRLLPLGRGRNAEKIILDNDDWFYFLCEASDLYDYGFDVRAEITPFCWLTYQGKVNAIAKQKMNNIIRMNRGCYMWIAQLALDHKGRVKFCPTGSSVGPSVLDVSWPEFWTNWLDFELYRSFLWNNVCIDFENQESCSYFYQCLGGCKYSKGKHYAIDRYALNFVNLGRSHEEISKTK